MNFLRIIFGLLLVILPISGTHSSALNNASVPDLNQSQTVKKSTVKDNVYGEAAMLEVQEKVSSVAKVKEGGQNLSDWGNFLNNYFAFNSQLNQNRDVHTAIRTLRTASSRPRYILYHCLIIPL